MIYKETSVEGGQMAALFCITTWQMANVQIDEAERCERAFNTLILIGRLAL